MPVPTAREARSTLFPARLQIFLLQRLIVVVITQSIDRFFLLLCRYLFFLGTLCAQFTFVGYEAPAQFAEETKRADVAVPWGIVWSVIANFGLGLSYMLTLLFCIQARAKASRCVLL